MPDKLLLHASSDSVRTEPLRRPARSGAVGDELAQRVAVAGDQRVNGVGRAADDPAGVPPPVRPDQVPAGVALLLGNRLQEPAGLLVVERQEGQLPAPVERGDDPRRPPAEASAAVVEQNRAFGHRPEV